MECIILAGGFGTRLRSVVSDIPKCMAPVADKPFLYYLLQWIGRHEVNRIILSVGYLHESIEKWIADNVNLFNFSIDFVLENEPLGTGGAIRLALNKIKSDMAVIINGDTFFDIDIDRFVKQHCQNKSILSAALKPMKNFDRYGNVLLNNTVITRFNEKEFCEDGLINGGIYVMNKENRFFDGLPDKFSFETDVLQPAAKNGLIQGFVFDSYFIDIGIPEDYARANRELVNVTDK